MDTPPSKSARPSKALKHAKNELKNLEEKMRQANEKNDKLFDSIKRLRNAHKKHLIEMEGIQEAIKSQQFIVSDMKSHHKTVVESPGSVITDYTFPNHSLDDEMAEAASLMEEKAASLMEEKMSGNAEKKMSGNAEKNHEKKTSV